MKGLIQKSGYIKPGNSGGHYAEYIATRDGVELMEPTAGGGYLEYIAERPRSHGLFSADGAADLEQTMEEINAHAGPVWTFIYSLKREDAARLGYENGESWRTAGSGNPHPRETSTPSSSWITSMTTAAPMCSSLPPSSSTTWAVSFRTTPFRPARRAARERIANCSRKSVRRRLPWATSRTTMRRSRTWAA